MSRKPPNLPALPDFEEEMDDAREPCAYCTKPVGARGTFLVVDGHMEAVCGRCTQNVWQPHRAPEGGAEAA